jgi:putative spermidine/putrescine transport system permease protein
VNLSRSVFTASVVVLMAFLLAPVLLVFPISLSADNYIAWPPSGWSLRWYVQLAHDDVLIGAFLNSLLLGAAVTLLSVTIALPAAVMLVRREFFAREAVLSLLTAPLLLPTIVLGLAILIVFVRLNLVGTWTGMLLAHLTLTLPYALRVLATGLKTLPIAVEDAAATLGGRPLTVFRRITLPLMMPAMVAAASLSFLVSFDEVVISLFIVGPKLKVLPVSLYLYVESRTDPLVAAASALLVLATLLIVVVLERAIGVRRAIGG